VIDGMVSLAGVGRRRPRLETVDVTALAGQVADELRAEHPGREVQIDIEGGLTFETDALLAEVVLANLLDNAWKFTAHRPRAHIAVGAVARDGRRACFVRDDGVGFDPAYAHKLFIPFESLHTAGEFPGTGVGLATVARTLETLGGTCWAEGRPGKGATFFVVFSETRARE
jgi:light-regulated signal transduction histidine kinase (bacteriophytochrome)